MSGGHFDYSYYKMQDMARLLRIELDHNTEPNNHGYCPNFPPETVATLREILFLLDKCGELAEHTEWLYSGDIGECTFDDRVRPLLKEIRSYYGGTRR